jgi:alkylation response protein AidB-like acyl-CoA dehydrogenase
MPRPVSSEAARLHATIREFAAEFADRSKEIEDGRRVPHDIAIKLRRLGLFRSLMPRSVGGLELNVADVVPMLETLAAADSSVGARQTLSVMLRTCRGVRVGRIDAKCGGHQPARAARSPEPVPDYD